MVLFVRTHTCARASSRASHVCRSLLRQEEGARDLELELWGLVAVLWALGLNQGPS